MRMRWLVLLVAMAPLFGACSDDGLCGDDSGEAIVEIDATALVKPRSLLKICTGGLCNEVGATSLVVTSASGGRPSWVDWQVDRMTGAVVEPITGGRIELSCGSEAVSVLIVLDADGNAAVSGINPLGP